MNTSQKLLFAVLSLKFILLLLVICLWFSSYLLVMYAYLFHYLYDMVSIIIALAASVLSATYLDRYSFVYYRYTVLASFLNGIFLLLINSQIFISAIIHILSYSSNNALLETNILISHSHDLNFVSSEQYVFYFMLIKLIVNCVCIYILHRDSQSSLSLRIVLLHIISDVLTEFIALISSCFALYTNLTILDSVGSIIVVSIISIEIVKVVGKSAQILCNGNPQHIQVNNLIQSLKNHFKLIKDVYHIHIWHITETKFISSMHIVTELSSKQALDLNAINQHLLQYFQIVHNTIQIETKTSSKEKITCLPHYTTV